MSRTVPRGRSRRLKRGAALAAALAVVAMVAPPAEGQQAPSTWPVRVTDGPVIDAPRFREVGRVPLPMPGPEDPETTTAHLTGWLVLDPASRRGYTLVEGYAPTGSVVRDLNVTFIQSFDLDTLALRRRYMVPGGPLPTTEASNPGEPANALGGEVVHAVDPVAKRVYLPWWRTVPNRKPGDDGRRWFSHVLVIDEEAFDRDPASGLGVFAPPASQRHLAAHNLMGLMVSRHHVPADRPGKLLAVMASPHTVGTVPFARLEVPGGVLYDHYLVRWDPSAVTFGAPVPTDPLLQPPPLAPEDGWGLPLPLTACANGPLTSGAGPDAETINTKTFQWDFLVTREEVFLGCQAAQSSGAVVRIPLDSTTGVPVRTASPTVVPLGRRVADVLADDSGRRLLLRSFGGGATWWVFDGVQMRFSGSVAVHVNDTEHMSAGVDPFSGRLYTLTSDTCAAKQDGLVSTRVPIRGGLKVADIRLDPVPALESVIPDLAYPSHWRIRVDPVTRRVFVRRGHYGSLNRLAYPECDQRKAVDTPQELFYRVYEDGIPPTHLPGELDDATLTTDVDEAEGLTEASYLGAGTGYGSRSLLIGGLDAATNGGPTTVQSLCGRDDREALAGSVGKVEVSDQSTVAEAAALDADARTQEALGDPLSRCRPQSGNATFDKCYEDVREGAFDQAERGEDENEDGCDDRDGENRYAASCLGTRDAANPGFDDDEHNVPRDGLEARATCDERDEKASGSATGSLSTTSLQQADPVKVARSSSTVTVSRKAGKGVTVKVDSIARGVDIPGVGTIGVVRAEATSTATGRDGRASATFTRTICDVDIQGLVVSGCLGDENQQQAMVEALNDALGGRGTARLRTPDQTLARGTPHGYLAALQRDRKELFYDQTITKDRSLAVPALEIVMYRGEGGEWGAGRQVFQLAGVQASTSYGIACTYGRKADGSCGKAGEEFTAFGDLPSGPGDGSVTTITETLPGESAVGVFGSPKENLVTRLLRAVPRAVAEALRLLFNNPRELGLLAALWALLYAPCYLGDRRRAIRQVAARRL